MDLNRKPGLPSVCIMVREEVCLLLLEKVGSSGACCQEIGGLYARAS